MTAPDTRRQKWDQRMLVLAALVATWPKGSVHPGPERHRRPGLSLVLVGFNGFTRSVQDSRFRLTDREVKLRLILHAEANAMAFADQSLVGCSLYTRPLQPCAQSVDVQLYDANLLNESAILRSITIQLERARFFQVADERLFARENP